MTKILTNSSALYAHGQLAAETAKSAEDVAKKLMQGARIANPDEEKFSASALLANSSLMNNTASRSYVHFSDAVRSTDTASGGTTYRDSFGDLAFISDETRKKLDEANPAKQFLNSK